MRAGLSGAWGAGRGAPKKERPSPGRGAPQKGPGRSLAGTSDYSVYQTLSEDQTHVYSVTGHTLPTILWKIYSDRLFKVLVSFFLPLTTFINKAMLMAIDTYTQLSVKDSPESDHLGTIIWKNIKDVCNQSKGGLATNITYIFCDSSFAGCNSSRSFAATLHICLIVKFLIKSK